MRILVIFIMMFVCQLSFSQGFNVRECKQNINDGSAFQAPLGADGHPCGLIKVRTDNAELKFMGNIVGEVENKTNEYWVYMAQGSRILNVLHPNFLPIQVDFAEYGVDGISSKATYILTLSEQKFKKEKCGLVATVKPETASLYLNDVFIENISGNGFYQLYLPKGDYVCRIEQKGYRPNVQAISVGKCSQNLNVELESIMADLEVKCKTSTAEIYIDGVLKGNGSWKGTILAGEHQIEARLENFESITQSISVAEKESRMIVMPELKRSKGKFFIQSVPSDMPVTIDGYYVGKTPCTVEVESGVHQICCNKQGKFGCSPLNTTENLLQGELKTIELKLTISGYGCEDAYNGKVIAIEGLVDYYFRMNNYEEALYWAKRHPLATQLPQLISEDFNTMLLILYPEKAEAALKSMEKEDMTRKQWGGNWAAMGKAYKYQHKYKDAIRCYLIACERDKLSERINYMSTTWWYEESLGDCYKQEGNYQEAANCYKIILSMRSDNSEYDGMKRVEEKLKELK